jgi:hypothetical protein
MKDVLYHPNFVKLLRNFPLILDARDPKRRMIEWTMTKGIWSGSMAEVS